MEQLIFNSTRYCKKLTNADSLFLVKQYQRCQSDREGIIAFRTLVESHKGLIYKLAYKYTGMLEISTLDDLTQSAVLSFREGLLRFDCSLGFKFSTYMCYYILQGIRAEIYKVNSAIRVPQEIRDLIRSIKRYINEYNLENNCNPTKKQISEKFGLSQDKILLYLCVISPVKSLNCTSIKGGSGSSGSLEEGDPGELLNIIPSHSTSPEDYTLSHELKSIIKQVVKELPIKEASIIDAYFNISSSFPKPKTLEELAEEYNTYSADIRNIINKGLRLIRQSNHIEALRYYA